MCLFLFCSRTTSEQFAQLFELIQKDPELHETRNAAPDVVNYKWGKVVRKLNAMSGRKQEAHGWTEVMIIHLE